MHILEEKMRKEWFIAPDEKTNRIVCFAFFSHNKDMRNNNGEKE